MKQKERKTKNSYYQNNKKKYKSLTIVRALLRTETMFAVNKI